MRQARGLEEGAKHVLAMKRVEAVGEVDGEEGVVWVVEEMSLNKVNGGFDTVGRSDAELEWSEKLLK